MTNPQRLILEQMELGPMQNFQYFLGDAASADIAVVDPAWDVDFLCAAAERKKYKIKAVFLTHGHPDHVNGLKEILSRHDVPAYISRHEHILYKPRHKNIVEVEDGQILQVGTAAFECLRTPGHTPGSLCFRHENILITGDTLFIDGCGRCDLPGGSAKQLYNSLYNVILKLPDSTIIYPGHNYGSQAFAALASLKKTNPYLSCRSMEEFLCDRLGIM